MVARAWLSLTLYIFLILPINILNVNYDQFDSAPQSFIYLILIGSLFNLILLLISFKTSQSRDRVSWQLLPISLLFLLVLFESITPLNGDSLSGLAVDGNLITRRDIVIDTVILILVISAGYLTVKSRKRFDSKLLLYANRAALVFCTALLTANVFSSVHAISWKSLVSELFYSEQRPKLENSSEPVYKRPNIYHLIFDAFGSSDFENALAASNRPNLLSDFTFFPDARSNYDHTTPSIASVRLGRMNFQEESFSTFIDNSKTQGIDNLLARSGYRVSSYGENEGWIPADASYFYTNDFATKDYLGQYGAKSYLLFDFWILRLLPGFLQEIYYQNGSGVFSRFWTETGREYPSVQGENERTVASMFLVRRLIEDENLRSKSNEYVYMHSYLTHGPYVVNSDCSWSSQVKNSDNPRDYYLPQTVCALNLLQELVDKLIMQDKYDSSLIIVHADHGTWEVGLPADALLNSKSLFALENNPRLVPPSYVVNQSKPLLLVKLPSEKEKRIGTYTDNRPVSLIDVAPTLLQVAGVNYDSSNLEGLSLITNKIPDRPWRSFQMGFKQVTDLASRKTETLSQDSPKLLQKKFKIYPDGTFEKENSYWGRW